MGNIGIYLSEKQDILLKKHMTENNYILEPEKYMGIGDLGPTFKIKKINSNTTEVAKLIIYNSNYGKAELSKFQLKLQLEVLYLLKS